MRVNRGVSDFEYSGKREAKGELLVKEEAMHFHFCSECTVVITIDEGRICPQSNDHEEGLCEECAQAQPGWDDSVMAR